jgi:hypothetical protein
MAGKRQHYVPRLLQRGFLADPETLADLSDESERTWLHRAGAPAKPVGIRDVGVEDWFYSRKSVDGGPSLDDAITEFERDLSKDVAALRAATIGMTIDADLAARTVVHLVIRTAHLRRTISSGIEGTIGQIETLFTDPDRLGSMLGLTSPKLASTVTDSISRCAQDLVPAGFPPAFSERFLTFFVRERADHLIEQAASIVAPLLPSLFDSLAAKVRHSHNALVAKPLDDHGWVAALSSFIWTIEAGAEFILPDAVALAAEEGGVLAPLLFTTGADAAVVLLPIARNRMLVGRRNPTRAIDLTTFNAEAATSCQSFFIAARSFDPEMLSSAIGSGPAKTLDQVIAHAISNTEKANALAPGRFPPARPRELKQQNFTVRLTLHDFGNDVLASEYAEILQSVIGILSRDMPLYGLDGITIAADYNDALAKLDRGDEALPPVVSGALDYGIGVAMPVTVKREGRWKEHLVFAAGIAEGWTSDQREVRADHLHLLIKMLAGIGHSTLYADTPGFVPDVMSRELHIAVARTPSSYWSAKQAAFVAPDQGQSYAELVLRSLEHARGAIRSARERMIDETDVGEAFKIGLECVSALLTHAADWLGHRDGLTEGQAFDGDDLPTRLSAHGLDHLLTLFGRDLAACYAEDGALDISVVATLSRHIERLFWSLGIYCWPKDDQLWCLVTDHPLPALELPSIDLL